MEETSETMRAASYQVAPPDSLLFVQRPFGTSANHRWRSARRQSGMGLPE